MYTVAGMTDKNKDVLLKDLLDLVGSSGNQFLQRLFPDRPDPDSKKRPPTAGDKIKVEFSLTSLVAFWLTRSIHRLPLTLSSRNSCDLNLPIFERSNLIKIDLRLNTIRKRFFIRSSTWDCKRMSGYDELDSLTGILSRRWLNGESPFLHSTFSNGQN